MFSYFNIITFIFQCARRSTRIFTSPRTQLQRSIPPGGSGEKFQLFAADHNSAKDLSYPVDSDTKPTAYGDGEIVVYKKDGNRRLGKVIFAKISEIFRSEVIINVHLTVAFCPLSLFLFFPGSLIFLYFENIVYSKLNF